MDSSPVQTLLCLASYEKGADLLREGKRLGCTVILITVAPLEHIDWPRESIDELYVMPDLSALDDVINGVSYLARTHQIDRIIPLDDYDVLTAAALREHLRLPGMGASLARRFRDKLAMRVAARDGGVLVPDFVHVLNHQRIHQYTQRVPTPWVLKPRAEVSSIGIARVDRAGELWGRIEQLGDRQSHYLIERYILGDVYHVDSLVNDGQVLFAEVHQYARPPMDVFHGGGIAMSRTVRRGSEEEQLLQELNGHVLAVLGMDRGVSHMEFIKGHEDGRFYFLEVGARVGGANTAEMIEAATGISLWREWVKLEVSGDRYQLPERRFDHGGVLLSLAREEYPDTSSYTEPEIVQRVRKRHHVGFVLAAETQDRITALQQDYSARVARDFAATMPAYEERPPT
jgi:biotin carboxylase